MFVTLLHYAHNIKGGSKVRVLGQGAPNDFKFCMQGAFVGYFWVLVKLRSCDLYWGQTHLVARKGLAFVEVAWTLLEQNSILTHKSPKHANFQWGLSYRNPLIREPALSSPPFDKEPNQFCFYNLYNELILDCNIRYQYKRPKDHKVSENWSQIKLNLSQMKLKS